VLTLLAATPPRIAALTAGLSPALLHTTTNHLATVYGWRPTGTVAEGVDQSGWDRSSVVHEGQSVSAADVATLADALQRALPDIPDHDALRIAISSLAPGQIWPAGIEQLVVQNGIVGINPSVSPFEYFAGIHKTQVRRFIEYCQRGAFAIK
jgi:hypothetical protein